MVKNFIKSVLKNKGFKIVNEKQLYPDIELEFKNLSKKVIPFTMTSVERLYSLFQAVKYIHQNKIEGDFVECGVWKGGSSMMAALSFLSLGDTKRKFLLYDTYEGMSEPTEKDVDFKNDSAFKNWKKIKEEKTLEMCYNTLDEVEINMRATAYPSDKIQFIKGKVEDTIPANLPGKIAILRLDTDWYESTYHELKHLYPLVQSGGVLIIDDYGYWKGAREAVDQYFKEENISPLLHRIDHTGRIMIKK